MKKKKKIVKGKKNKNGRYNMQQNMVKMFSKH